MADLQKKDAVVSNVQLDADSLEFDVNTNLPLMAAKVSPGGPTPSLQELIEAELSVRLCQPDSLEPPSSPTLHSLLSCDSIEPVPALSAVPPSAPVFSLDSLVDLDPLKDPLGQADAESGIDLLFPTKLDNLSNPDSLESSDLMESPARSSPPPRGNFPLLYDVPDSHNEEIASSAVQAPLLTMKENLATVVGEALLSSAPGPTQKSQEYHHSNTEVIHQFHLSDDSNVDLQAGQMLLQVSDSDLLSVESLSVSKSGSGDPSDLSETSGDLCATPDFSNSNSVQGDGAPHTTSEDVCESGDWAAGGLAAPGVSLIPGLTLASNSPSTDPSSSSPPPSSPQDPSSSPLPPSPHAGALTPSSTNSVCGDSSHAGDEDCGVGIGWSGDDGGGERPCHPPSCDDSGQDPPPPTHTNMEEEEEDEDDDFWSSMKNDEDNDRLASNNSYMKEEEEEEVETKLEYVMKYSEKSECRVESSETREYQIKYSEKDEYDESKFFEEDEARMEEDEEDDNLEIEDEDDEALLETKGLLLRKKKSRAENGVSKIEEATEKKPRAEKIVAKLGEPTEKKPRAEKIVPKLGEPTEKKPRAEKIVAKTEEPSEKRKPQAENGVAKTEESTEKKKSRAEKIVEKAEEPTDKKPRAENGVDSTEEVTEKKKKKKIRSSEDGEKRKKKKKRGESEKENKKATYQHRDDILAKHVGPRVRSFDASKMKSKFEKPKQVCQVSSDCRQCGKQVFQMEKIVAEKASWHKNCFRCKECNCVLTLETYQSHEGVLYCKPHFKELFRPKVVVEDEYEARKERSSNTSDYGLEELSTTNLKQKFAMFELISTEEERRPDPIPVRRSQSLLGKAARFQQSEDDDYGIENAELGEYEECNEEEEDEDEDEEEEEGNDGEIKKKKGRPTSFSGMQDLKAGFDRKNRREEMTKKRREELSKFRQMLCAGKNITTREMFEGGNEDEEGLVKRKEQIKIDGCPAAKNLRERFEKGLSINEEDEETEERREVDHVFRQADTATKARNMFKKIDTAVVEGEEPVMRPRSSAQARKENRLSRDGKRIRNFASQVFDEESKDSNEEDEQAVESSSLVERFKFFSTYEDRAKEDKRKPRKLFRITPPLDGEDKGIDVEERELGRDPNLIKCTDVYEDEVDCRGTRDLLAKFRKLEMQAEDDEEGPRPLKRFTPPPGGEEYDSEEDYSDEEYSDEEDDSEEEDEEEEEDERKPKYKDEILEMVNSSQSARKAASLRAKFEKWETEVERNNEFNHSEKIQEEEEEGMPSIDTARNLRAMFENKAQEAARPVTERSKPKVNRFV